MGPESTGKGGDKKEGGSEESQKAASPAREPGGAGKYFLAGPKNEGSLRGRESPPPKWAAPDLGRGPIIGETPNNPGGRPPAPDRESQLRGKVSAGSRLEMDSVSTQDPPTGRRKNCPEVAGPELGKSGNH